MGRKVLQCPRGLWWRVSRWWELRGPQVAAVGWAAAMWEAKPWGACRLPPLRNKWGLSVAQGLCTEALLAGFPSLLPTLPASHCQTSSIPEHTRFGSPSLLCSVGQGLNSGSPILLIPNLCLALSLSFSVSLALPPSPYLLCKNFSNTLRCRSF